MYNPKSLMNNQENLSIPHGKKTTYTQQTQDDDDVGVIRQNFKAAIITLLQEVGWCSSVGWSLVR